MAIFAAGYMHGDPGYPRFFAAFSLFVFSMCMLVLSRNFLQLFIFWEGVGLCSYLLIGFWYRKPAAAAAAKKAFVVNRIGDFGFLIGIFLIWTTFGSLDFETVLLNPARIAEVAAANPGTITAICLLLLLGRDGQERPVPAARVAARRDGRPHARERADPRGDDGHRRRVPGRPLDAAVPVRARRPGGRLRHRRRHGAARGADRARRRSISSACWRIRRSASSATCSWPWGPARRGPSWRRRAVTAGMFHLFTHGFFKALLFLAAGSVMHSMGDVIDMRRFSGLRKALPITHWTFLCGAAALAGLPLLAGFWSKDEILAVLSEASHHEKYGAVFHVGVLGRDDHGVAHGVLHVPRVLPDLLGRRAIPGRGGPSSARCAAGDGLAAAAARRGRGGVGLVGRRNARVRPIPGRTRPGLPEAEHHGFDVPLMVTSSLVALAGICAGVATCTAAVSDRRRRRTGWLQPLYELSLNKFYLDEIVLRRAGGAASLAVAAAVWFDDQVIDRTVDLVGAIPRWISAAPRHLHEGVVPSYSRDDVGRRAIVPVHGRFRVLVNASFVAAEARMFHLMPWPWC